MKKRTEINLSFCAVCGAIPVTDVVTNDATGKDENRCPKCGGPAPYGPALDELLTLRAEDCERLAMVEDCLQDLADALGLIVCPGGDEEEDEEEDGEEIIKG